MSGVPAGSGSSSPAVPLPASLGFRKIPFWQIRGVAMVFLGGCLLAVANRSVDPMLIALAFLPLGLFVASLVGGGAPFSRRCFLLTYGVCVTVAGCAQFYAQIAFNSPMTAIDANLYYDIVRRDLHYESLNALRRVVNAPLAVFVWTKLYGVLHALGLERGPWIGVLFNSVLVGLSGTMTVRAAYELLGDDSRRLRRLTRLYALCGMFWLFGALFVRGSFVLLLNAVVLWALLRFLAAPSPRTVIVAGVALVAGAWFMFYLRVKAVPMFAVLAVLTFVCWYLRAKINQTRILLAFIVPVTMAVLYPYALDYAQNMMGFAAEHAESYAGLAGASSTVDSLGMRMIVNRGPILRVPMGTVAMLVSPIPLWSSIAPGVAEYHLLKLWQGLYLVLIMPLVLTGMTMVLRVAWTRGRRTTPYLFLMIYVIVTLEVVVMTSLETRHHGQFLPALILFAALPDTRSAATRRMFGNAAMLWFGLVVAVHVVWATLK